ncbi:MAG: hypothetical protein KGY61_10505 [Desulfobacterales bacterium]|nr:hypothetical protein [Desulfobacterales bacterium]
MSVDIPRPNIFDRLLKGLGKPRGVIIPEDAHQYHGKAKRIVCKKESVWISLWRSKKKGLPEDRADIFLLQKIYRKNRP